jgi:hypothetical protein
VVTTASVTSSSKVDGIDAAAPALMSTKSRS